MAYYLMVDGESFPLKHGINIIGRESGCDGRILDPHVSRKHLSIDVLADGTMTLLDLGSSNGLFIRGRRVPNAIIKPGQEFTIGTKTLVIQEK